MSQKLDHLLIGISAATIFFVAVFIGYLIEDYRYIKTRRNARFTTKRSRIQKVNQRHTVKK